MVQYQNTTNGKITLASTVSQGRLGFCCLLCREENPAVLIHGHRRNIETLFYIGPITKYNTQKRTNIPIGSSTQSEAVERIRNKHTNTTNLTFNKKLKGFKVESSYIQQRDNWMQNYSKHRMATKTILIHLHILLFSRRHSLNSQLCIRCLTYGAVTVFSK